MKVSSGLQLYGEKEVQRTRGGGNTRRAFLREARQEGGQEGSSTVEEGGGMEGMEQKRGEAHKQQDKHRGTLEVTQEVHHWLQDGKAPVGKVGRSMLMAD